MMISKKSHVFYKYLRGSLVHYWPIGYRMEALNMITRVGNYASEYGGEIAKKHLGFDPNEAPKG